MADCIKQCKGDNTLQRCISCHRTYDEIRLAGIMKQKFISLYADWVKRVSLLSDAKRLKVGAIIVKDDSVISYGYNGMPSGFDNECEIEVNGSLITKPEVLHAERNALDKLTKKGGLGASGATMFCTHSPCIECAKSILQSGITEVIYLEDYHSANGVELLNKAGIVVKKV